MNKITIYLCEICGEQFYSEECCIEHEKSHIPLVRTKRIKGSIYEAWGDGYATRISVEYENGNTYIYTLSKCDLDLPPDRINQEDKR